MRQQRVEKLTDKEALALLYEWEYWARPKQLAPINRSWYIWMLLAGRGFGKTRTGAEWIRKKVEKENYNGRIHLIGPTAGDVRDVMIEGESGLLSISPPWFRPVYEPSKRRLTWPNGAEAITFSAEQPERLRGPQCGLMWADELAAWKYRETWDMAMFGFRKGNPQAIVTTTPKPRPLVKEILKTEGVVITKGSTYENRDNLADIFFDTVIKKYEGTRLGEQELHAKLLEDTPGALWSFDLIADNRITYKKFKEIDLVKIAVAIDPAVSSNKETSNETGIVAGGIDANGEGYILADKSGIYKPAGWARTAIKLFAELKADRMVAEINNGGELVESTIRTYSPRMPYTPVRASRGKTTRAEPISALYEQGLVHHVGSYAALEDQMTTWDASDGSDSPDRVDALVWLLTYLMLMHIPKQATSRQG